MQKVYIGARSDVRNDITVAQSSTGVTVAVEGPQQEWLALYRLIIKLCCGLSVGSTIYCNMEGVVSAVARGKSKKHTDLVRRANNLVRGTGVRLRKSHLMRVEHHQEVWGDLSPSLERNKFSV